MQRLLLLLCLVLLSTPAFAGAPALAPAQAPLDKDALKALDTYIRRKVREVGIVGLSVAIDRGGQRWTRGYGLRDREARLPATPRTSYRYASVTKPMTAVAALRLAERGLMDLDAPIQRYVPYYPKKKWTVTARHLAGLLGGIPHYVNCDLECHITEHYSTERAIGIFKDWPLLQAPGERWVYSSYSFNLLGAALEGATGDPYAKVMRAEVWGPAGMRSTRMDDPEAEVVERARGYRLTGRGVVPSEVIDVSSRFAGGGTRGNVVDLVRFGRALLDGALLSERSFETFSTTMVTAAGENTDYGWGIGTFPQGGRWVLSHGGGQPETSTFLAMYPAEDLVIALGSNVEGLREPMREITSEILTLLLQDGRRRRRPAGVDAVSDLFAAAAYKTFSHGLARYRWRGPRPHENIGPLLEAFGELNLLLDPALLGADPESMAVVLELADDPAGGSLFPRVGAHMAAVVARHKGPERAEAMLIDGPFTLFTEYADACLDFDCPDALRLAPPLVSAARDLQEDWARSNTEAIQRAALDRRTRPEELEGLVAAFDGARVRPDLSAEIARVASPKVLRTNGKRAKVGHALLEVAARVYPRSSVAAMACGEARLVVGDRAGALEMFARWSALRPNDDQRAKKLRAQARALRRRHPEAQRALLYIAAELFPDDSETWDALGKVEQRRGRAAEARAALERAEALRGQAPAAP